MDSYDYNNVSWDTDFSPSSKLSPPKLSSNNPYYNGGSDEDASYRDPDDPRQSLSSPSRGPTSVSDENDRPKIQTELDPVSKKLNIVPMEILVSEPHKENENTTDVHISYLITTKTSLPSFTAPEVFVRRRFQDFVWLFNGLVQVYPASVVPPLPEKHRMEYLTGDRFSEDFIEKRRVSLERFLNRLALHPTLQRSPYMKEFLDSPDWSSTSVRVHGEGLLENISESIVNAFTKIKRPDPVFVEIKDAVEKFEENLTSIEKMHQKILKRNTEIEAEYVALSNAITSLSLLETGMQDSLSLFSGIVNDYGMEVKNSNKTEDMYYLSHIREYIAYCQCVKSVLKLREQKQLDVQELTNYLQAQVGELDRIRSTGRSGGFSSFLKDKYEGMKGVDQEQAKQARIAKCEERIAELEDAVAKSNTECAAFSKEVLKEFEVFQHSKTVDLKDALVTYSRNKVEFFKRSIKIWEAVIPEFNTTNSQLQTENPSPRHSAYPESSNHFQEPLQNQYAGDY